VFAWSPKVGWGSKGRSKVGRVLSTVNLRRKLVVIAGHMLSKGEDYAFAQALARARKDSSARAAHRHRPQAGRAGLGPDLRDQEAARSRARLARQAEHAYARLVRDWQPAMNKSAGAGARISSAVKRPSSAAGDSPKAKNDSPTQEMNAWRIRQAASPPSVTATL
jgi:hypothetical protein